MERAQVEAYLNESKIFFGKLLGFLNDRIAALEQGGQGGSRYVTEWISKVAQINAEFISSKFNIVYPKIMAKDALESDFKILVRKITRRLEQAQDFLQEVVSNANISARFIPVERHRQQAEDSQKLLDQCNLLLTQYEELSDQVDPYFMKSWFLDTLYFGSILVGIRAAALGLFRKQLASEETEKANMDAMKLLQELNTKIGDLEEIHKLPTKYTKWFLNVDNAQDTPPADSAHYGYFPEDIKAPLAAFQAYMKPFMEPKDAVPDGLTKEAVLEAVKVDFPKPSR